MEQGLAKASELIEVESQLASARAELQSARATLRTAGLSEKQTEALLSSDGSLTLRAPMAGMVTEVSTRQGEVRAPTSGPLVELVAASDVLIEARFVSLPPGDVRLVWLGPQGEVALKVQSVAPRASERDGMRVVWLVPEPGPSAPVSGELGRVHIVESPAWRSVPAGALSTNGTVATVSVRRGDQVVSVPVQVVLRGPNDAVVTGIGDDDLVVLPEERRP
jgi:hypothetical protein